MLTRAQDICWAEHAPWARFEWMEISGGKILQVVRGEGGPEDAFGRSVHGTCLFVVLLGCGWSCIITRIYVKFMYYDNNNNIIIWVVSVRCLSPLGFFFRAFYRTSIQARYDSSFLFCCSPCSSYISLFFLIPPWRCGGIRRGIAGLRYLAEYIAGL